MHVSNCFQFLRFGATPPFQAGRTVCHCLTSPLAHLHDKFPRAVRSAFLITTSLQIQQGLFPFTLLQF